MNALRWILGTVGLLFGGGFFILAIIGNSFRKSFGASDNHPLLITLPLLGIALLLAAILLPANKPLLHAAAVAAIGLVGFCFWQIIRESAVPLWFVIAYLAAWFVYYWHAAWRIAPQP